MKDRLPLFRNTAALSAGLEKQFLFSSISISKQYPHTLVVTVRERTARAVWHIGSYTFIIDATGALLRAAMPDDSANRALAHFVSEVELVPVSAPIPPSSALHAVSTNSPTIIIPPPTTFPLSTDIIDHALTTLDAVNHIPGIHGTQMKIPLNATTWLKFTTDEGWDMYLDLGGDTNAQLLKLAPILTKVGDGRKKLHYIDLRFGDRAYFK